MDIRFDDRDAFSKLAGKFRAAGKDGAAIRKQLTKDIQSALKPVVRDIQQAARSMTVKGTRGRGTVRRAQFYQAKRPKGRITDHGLRATVARAVKSRVQYTGRRLGAKVYIDSAVMPRSQRSLPRALNRAAGWRHPVWGHRDRWVGQVGEPYFDRPVERHRAEVRRAVAKSVNEVLRKLR